MKKHFTFLLVFTTITVFSQTGIKKITLEDIFKNRIFSSKGTINYHFSKDGDHYYQVKNDSLNLYEISTGNFTRTIVTSAKLIPRGDSNPVPVSTYEFSDDESRILFYQNDEPIYRRSTKADYYVYDIKTEKIAALSQNGKQRLATFSPDGSKIAYVRDNNLYLADVDALLAGSVIPGKNGYERTEIRITIDGKVNEIINGSTDWVYEEEFEFSKAFFWSPDSKKIAFYRFDESKVREYELIYYGDLYPEQYKYKYPKAGENNSRISLFIRDLASGISIPVDIGIDTDIYIPRVKWTRDPDILAFYRMNHHQDKLELLYADAVSGRTRVIYSEVNKAYIGINDDLTFLKGNKGFFLTSEKDGYHHIYLYNFEGQQLRQLTNGHWDVMEILGLDEQKGLIYYSCAQPSPLDRNICTADLDGKEITKISDEKGSTSAKFSPGFGWYAKSHSDINTPPVVTINRAGGQQVRMIENNEKLKETMNDYGFSKAEFFSFKTDDNVVLNGWMVKPPDFDPGMKYPVMFTIYGGPGVQTVMNRWGAVSSWNQLWAQHGIIVVSVDNRGSGGRGEEFLKCTYLQLGKFETIDQIEAAKYLGTLPYVDKTRIGMWGWSFGGFMTLSCLTKGADYFKLGVAVAPVTNWKYYDNIYTERYMRTPKENPDGYESNSPINHADKLKGKLLLIHGMADDNVHPQNSYDFVTALVAAGKQFEMQVYPNSNHGIYSGKNTTLHLYNRMTEFILSNL